MATKKYKSPRLTGKTIVKEDMEKYDWSKKIFIGVTKMWVYYRVPLKGEAEYQNVRLLYDRDYDWDFEDDRG